jgi:SAM-dependent methyltransferase
MYVSYVIWQRNLRTHLFLFGNVDMHWLRRHLDVTLPSRTEQRTAYGDDWERSRFKRLLPTALSNTEGYECMTVGIHEHFSSVAPTYRDLRTTDPEPIAYIARQLRLLSQITAADVGCGAGRYNQLMFQYLGEKLVCLYCLDANRTMLDQVRNYLKHHGTERLQVVRSAARNLPFASGHLDCVFTFNAIHHFDARRFLREAARVLRRRGHLFIYTRFREQNSRNIWGKYFPLFCEKETRLHELNDFERIVGANADLRIAGVALFEYPRSSTLRTLVELARNRHYSTFCLYTESEFRESLTRFENSIRESFEDPENVTWNDENALLIFKKL